MKSSLLGSHQGTYDSIFRHPVSHNVLWRDIRSMFGAMADVVQEEHNGTLKVSRNGRTVVLHEPSSKNMADVHELMGLRRFLEQSNVAEPAPLAAGAHLLVVIDHRLARIYKTEFPGSKPQEIAAKNISGEARHLHNVQNEENGQRKPEQRSFYAAVVKAIMGAEKILLFGSGTGASSAMEHLFVELKELHPAVAERVVGAHVVDEQHMSESQLLAKAREVYAGLPS